MKNKTEPDTLWLTWLEVGGNDGCKKPWSLIVRKIKPNLSLYGSEHGTFNLFNCSDAWLGVK